MFNEITEELLTYYHKLSMRAKEMEEEMNLLKKQFNDYFDRTVGTHEKAELLVGDYKLQRQIRKTESFNDAKTIEKLEELHLNDCIAVVKKPDKEKIEAAVTLGIISGEDLKDCVIKKLSQAIILKEIKH
ncbi:hypothetical protein [Metabacillus arenae]|uniref:Uncharacterized protein n=1 Tax=Metabacillus arenae TaxID=2771434 RepID=A0A926NEY8_9BACI|nr:hypothetical protein [Metabacillus arenae]MBD1379590.1 hypothetical protein [Metabacillus arenae]